MEEIALWLLSLLVGALVVIVIIVAVCVTKLYQLKKIIQRDERARAGKK